MGDHAPTLAVEHEHIERGHGAAYRATEQVLVDRYPGGVTFHGYGVVCEDELQLLRTAEQREPRPGHRPPAPEALPARMGAHHPVGVLPDLGHRVDVAGLEGVVERTV